MLFGRNPESFKIPAGDDALPGRSVEIEAGESHFVNENPLKGPFRESLDSVVLGMGCFWGAERLFWQIEGVFVTAVGYAGGSTPNPTYEEVCSGGTGHTEATLVVFDPSVVELGDLLKVFWENHDPTTANRQGNDVGTQYRSGIYVNSDSQLKLVEESRDLYQARLSGAGFGSIVTEVSDLDEFYFAETYHQQYLAKVPNGYCNHGFCQVGFDS